MPVIIDHFGSEIHCGVCGFETLHMPNSTYGLVHCIECGTVYDSTVKCGILERKIEEEREDEGLDD